MADKRITELPELGRAPVSGDVFVLDTYSGATRKMDFASMKSAMLPVWASQVLSENGEYIATDMGAEGWSRVTVSVYPPLQEKYVSQNGTVTPDSGYYGLSEVEISVPNKETEILDGSISGYSNPQIESLREYAFARASVTSVTCPSCKTIAGYAFYFCESLTTVSFPMCQTIGSWAFSNCSMLTSVNFPACTTIESNAFSWCSKIVSVSFPACTTLKSGAFGYCTSLISISFPVCTSVGEYAFSCCSNLTSAYFPKGTILGNGAFYRCSRLAQASLPSCASIGSNAFSSCFMLVSLYLGGSSVATLANSSAFTNTPIAGYSGRAGRYGSIYVPASLLNSYKTASNWSYFSNRIFSYTE